jgi:hypothetical protein
MAATYRAGIKTIVYINPVMPQTSQYEYTDLSGTYSRVRATDCSGNIVTTYAGRGLLADPRVGAASAYYANVVNWYIQNKLAPYSAIHDWDAMFVDNNGALYGASATPCNYNPATWGQAFDTAISGVNEQFVTNSLAASDGATQTYVERLDAPNVIGGMFEQCFNDGMWTAEENSQLETIALLKSLGKAAGPGWWCYLDNTNAAGATVIPQRMFAYASFLLTYDPKYSIFQESFTTSPSTFQVFPETGLVPLQPASVPVSVNALESSTGVYLQTYGACYYRGAAVGNCEIVVNPDTSRTYAIPANAFGHAAVLSGGGVLDGGAMTFNGAKPALLGPLRAAILTP